MPCLGRSKPKTEKVLPKSKFGQMMFTGRQKMIFFFFVFYACVDITMLGLVSEQLQKYGNLNTRYPTLMYYHAIGLGLFSTIFYLIFAIFHWVVGHKIMMFLFLSGGVFFGTIAGILTATPFGHGIQCKHNADHFSEPWRRFAGDCARIQAIVGLSWAMFGLNTIGFFWAISDKFSCVSKRDSVYAPYVAPETHDVEKGDAAVAAH